MLGYETPANPGRVGFRSYECGFQTVEVEIRALDLAVMGVDERGCTQCIALIGLADEHRLVVGVRVQGDRTEIDTELEAQLADRVDGAHRRLAAVDDGDAREIHRSL